MVYSAWNLRESAYLRIWCHLGNVGYFRRAGLPVSGGNTVPVTVKKPHSRDLVSAVLFLKLSAAEKLVLQALCWHYPNAYPSVARIAVMASLSKRWVQHCFRTLQEKGLIEIQYRRNGQSQGTNLYTINPDRILMQAGKRAKTTLKPDGTEFRGGANSLPADGGELTSPKQSALDRDNAKSKIVKENRANKGNEQPRQEQELASMENLTPNDGGILADPPSEEVNPRLLKPLPVSSNANVDPTHPQPPTSAAPPSPSLPKPAPVFIRVGRALFKKPEGPSSIMIPHRGKLPHGAIVIDTGNPKNR